MFYELEKNGCVFDAEGNSGQHPTLDVFYASNFMGNILGEFDFWARKCGLGHFWGPP